MTIRNSSIYAINYRVEAISVPFEGYTASTSSIWYLNRGDSVQNGCIYKRFDLNGNIQGWRNIYLNEGELNTGNPPPSICLRHSSAQFPNDNSGMYGFAKYLITIEIPAIQKIYYAYFNNLDSKFGDMVNGKLTRMILLSIMKVRILELYSPVIRI